jgi:hypothetical protein
VIRYPFEEAPAPGAAVEVAPGILWMRIPLPMALDHVNVYALKDQDGWTLIDTGLDAKRCRAAWDAALKGPLAGRPSFAFWSRTTIPITSALPAGSRKTGPSFS